jgi:hypothetical protein
MYTKRLKAATSLISIDQVPRYSDKYNVTSNTKRPTLDKDSLDPKFFPKAVWTAYFDTSTGMLSPSSASPNPPRDSLWQGVPINLARLVVKTRS